VLLLLLLHHAASWRRITASACSWHYVALLIADVSTNGLQRPSDHGLEVAR
jgi:hypothetical protein